MRIPSAFLALTLLVPQLAFAAPEPHTPQEVAELNKMSQDLKRFKSAADSYYRTVSAIVRRAFEQRRGAMHKKFDRQIKSAESEERTRRIAAITLFEDFLRRYPNDLRWTPDVIFRLAELYFEKSGDAYLQATDRYEEDLKRYERKELDQAPLPPKQDYSQTVALHRRLIKDFPSYRLVDGAYYLLGFCLSEMGRADEGNQAMLSLVCSNKYKAPISEQDITMRAGGTRVIDGKPQYELTAYDDCVPLSPKSRFNAEAWVRVGEYHFDENQLGKAIAGYKKVLAIGPEKNSYYDEALYKLAWTYYRADKFIESIDHFDKLVVYADKERAKTGKAGSEMRPESIQYLAVSFAEDDWDGDQKPDAESGLTRADKFYAGRDQEKHVYEVYRRLGDIYFTTTKFGEAVAVYKAILKRWPYRADNPDIQDRIVTAFERQQDADKAMSEREAFSSLFGKGSEWERRNKNDPRALKKARDYDEQMLIQAAVFHHNAGRELRKQGLGTSNVDLLKRAQGEYAVAARAYERYLERFPHTKNSYELRFGYANCLYFSQRYLEAARVYEQTRDSNLDNRFQAEAALYAIKSYEAHVKEQVTAGKLQEPPLPDAKMAKDPAKKPLPEVFQRLQQSFDKHAKLLPKNAATPRMAYKAAEVSYRFIQFDDARVRFEEIYKKYCQDAMAVNAAQAILITYQLEKQRNLDKLQEWATKLSSGKCGGTAGTAHKAGATKLLDGIRFIRAQKLFAKAEELYKAGNKREAAPWYDKAAAAYLSLVESRPDSTDADKALFNAAVCYERSMRFDSATKIYERVWQKYPNSKLAGEAIWLSAESHKRFFRFDNAVNNYLILVDGPRFTANEHRRDAIFNAAQILEYDQNYSRAAQLFLRYAEQPGVKPKEAAEAYFRAGVIYGKMNNFGQMVKVLRAFPDKYGNVEGQKPRAVEAQYRIATTAERRGMWPTAKSYYNKTKQEYSIRRLPPAGDAAEYAAEATFKLLEQERLPRFLKTHMKRLPLKRVVIEEKLMAKQAIELKKEYGAILKYKRARWTLGALFRYGTIYEHFAKKVGEGYRTSPVPKQVRRLGQEALDLYQEQIDQALNKKVTPLEEEAKKLYAECVSRAKQLGVSNKYTEEAERRLNALDPDRYPLLKAPQTATAIE